MKAGLSVLLIIAIGFFCLFYGDPIGQNLLSPSKAFCLSVEKEKELGESVFREVEKQMEVIRVPSVEDYIHGLGRSLIANADTSPFPIRFFPVKQPEPNAFAIPGGSIFITSGLIRFAESEDELAGVMSHEIAHVIRRHISQRIEVSKRISIATLAGVLAGVLVGGSEGGAILTGSLALGESEKLRYTRENESEADRLGLAYMTRAGYDGRDMISFLRKIYQRTHSESTFPSYLSTHPGVPSRISYLETLMGGLPDRTGSDRSPSRLKPVQLRLLIVDEGSLESLDHFDGLLKMRPDDADALFGRALAQKEMGRVKESIEDLKRAHVLKPADPYVLRELGDAFIRVGRVDEGVTALERSRSLSENDAETLYYLGQGYQAQKRFDLAIGSYLKARELSNALPELDRSLGSAYKERGEIARSHLYYGFYFKNRGLVKYARFHFEKARDLWDQDSKEREEVLRELEQLKQ